MGKKIVKKKPQLQVSQALIIPDCVPVTSEVLTPDGWKPITDVSVGELIMASTATRELEFAPVRAKVPVHTAPVYTFKRGNVLFSSTKNHRHLTQSRESLKVRSTDELLALQSVSLVSTGNRRGGEDLGPDLLRLVGFCLGDGTRDTDNWRISVKLARKKGYLQTLVERGFLLSNQGPEYTRYTVRSAYTALVDTFMASDKALNWRAFLALTQQSMDALLEGMIESDGSRDPDRSSIRLAGVREEHVILWQTLSHLTDKNCIRGKSQDNTHSTFPSARPLHYALQSRGKDPIYMGAFLPGEGQEEVTCVTVDSSFFLVKQNGNILITGNCHIPYHNPVAYDLMLDVAKDLENLEEIVLLGDYADFYSVNAHGKDPGIEERLVDEIDSVNQELDRLDALWPEQKKVYITGNHEYRLDRYINDKAPDLWGTVNMSKLFQLKQRPNWSVIPYGPDQIYYVGGGQLAARHEPMGSGMNAAYQTVVKAGTSVVFGHIHQIQEFQVVMISGKNHRGISVGWLGDKSSKVMNYVKHHHQWSLGFGVANILPDGSFFHHTVHIIPDLKDKRVYRCSYGGKIYERGV